MSEVGGMGLRPPFTLAAASPQLPGLLLSLTVGAGRTWWERHVGLHSTPRPGDASCVCGVVSRIVKRP